MRIDILTIHPKLLKSPFEHSILQRAIDKKIVEIRLHDIRTYSTDKHKKVDDYQFGGGAGMVMCIQPIADCIDQLKSERNYDAVVYMTPDGERLDQSISNHYSTFEIYNSFQSKALYYTWPESYQASLPYCILLSIPPLV